MWFSAAPRLSVVLALGLAAAPLSCGEPSAASPFAADGGEGGEGGEEGGAGGEDAGRDPTLGGPCSDLGQCDDGLECTSDRCDLELQRCRFEPSHERCADDLYCDGEERCEPGLGCREGEPVSCSDNDACTIDRCIEADRSCSHELRDADGDGDPVRNCEGGTDCDDTDPTVYGGAAERCENEKDDDCDGELDEADCVRPEYDTCRGALEIEASGSYALSLIGAALDYPLACQSDDALYRDLVVALIVPEGGPMDVDVVASTAAASSPRERRELALGVPEQCGQSNAADRCVASYEIEEHSVVSRLRLRGVAPGAYPLYVSGTGDEPIALTVRYDDPAPAPANETCASAAPLAAGEHVTVSLVGAERDLETECPREVGELVYSFELAEARDVTLRAAPLDGFGAPTLSLRGAACVGAELTCRHAAPAELFARALPAGTYFVAATSIGPSEFDLVLELGPPSTPLPGEGCADPIELSEGTSEVDFEERTDAVRTGCLAGAADASYVLELAEASDVLLVSRLSEDDEASLLLAEPACGEEDALSCVASGESPLRLAHYGLPAGEYRVVAESAASKAMALDSFVRQAVQPVYVAFADECASAVTIPATGGRFEGNTATQYADYDASCDVGGGSPGGAPEQMLRLELDEPRRVIFDMRESEFETLLTVRRGPDCPGAEVALGCSASFRDMRSFLDLTLDAGQYFVQVDGVGGESGRYRLDVFVAEP